MLILGTNVKKSIMKHVAIILAGGIGSRVGGQMPKQLLPLEDGRSILEHSVDAFEQAPCIDEIAIVMHPEWMDEAKHICEKNNWRKVTKIIPGGSERWESSWHAILAYTEEESQKSLWFHDAARPFVSQRILSDIAVALEQHEAVTVAVPVTDTLYRVADGQVKDIPARSEYMRAQTPQAFHFDTVFQAYARAIESETVLATDDAGIVRKYTPATKIYIVQGEESNRKITYSEDLK